MQIESSELTFTPQGEDFTPLEIAARANPNYNDFTATNWTLAYAGTDLTYVSETGQASEVRMWTKGVEVTGKVKGKDGNSKARPELSGDCSEWAVGLIQVIHGQPTMKATYENSLSITWRQNKLPCYDSQKGGLERPWYNDATHTNVTNNTLVTMSFIDLPCAYTAINMTHLDHEGRLMESEKKIKFAVYLCVRKKGAHKRRYSDDLIILKHGQWETHTKLTLTWSSQNTFKYTTVTLIRTIYPVSEVRNKTDSDGLKASFYEADIVKVANEDITQAKLYSL